VIGVFLGSENGKVKALLVVIAMEKNCLIYMQIKNLAI
jgi:hypothetical protein